MFGRQFCIAADGVHSEESFLTPEPIQAHAANSSAAQTVLPEA